MGRDKALLELNGMTMWRRQRDVLAGAGAAEIFLSVRPEQEWARHTSGFVAHIYDALSTGGPMVGLTAALERTSHRHVAVLAIDLPAMNADWFRALLTECVPGVGAVGRHGDFFEPLAAVYPKEIMPLAWEALARGEFSLQRLLSAAAVQGLMRIREISPAEQPLFENWNDAGCISPRQAATS